MIARIRLWLRHAALVACFGVLLPLTPLWAGGRDTRPLVAPEVVEGEARGCGESAMRTVVHVDANHRARYDRPPAWYGWAGPPSVEAYRAAYYGLLWSDPTGGAIHLWSGQDVQRADVRAVIREGGLVLRATYHCEWGGVLHAYGEGSS